MKTTLKHLPELKQKRILEIAEMIKRVINPEKIILFGSYAKGTYVEHRYTDKNGTEYDYVSDFDYLVVTKETPQKASDLERDILRLTDHIDPPVNLEIHSIEYINKGLELGEYFFVDIVKEGILLSDTEAIQFVEPKVLTPQEKKEKAQRYFDTWFPQGSEFLITSQFLSDRENYKLAAFQLHQASESLYFALLLVFTDYKPKVHNLWKLRKKAKPFSEALFNVFKAESNKQDKYLFELLKCGYIDARYRSDYSITEEELRILIEKVKQMKEIVEKCCQEKIAALEAR